MKKLKISQRILVAMTLFGMFFGAGNLIFPVHLGQLAGSNYPGATVGPLAYLVVECTTILAPCSIGFIKYGVAIVLSTINGISNSLAIDENFSKSNTFNPGFPIVSP